MIRFFRTSFVIAALLFVLKPLAATSAEGDTTKVRVFDKYLWTYYGSQDRTVKFPAPDKKFKKVLMRYTLTCPAGGCGEWDYTTNVYFRRGLGTIDSVLKEAINFTANGKIVDSISFSFTPTWKTQYAPIKKTTDSSLTKPIQLYFFKDAANPTRVTDSLTVYPANYWNYYYKGSSARADSIFVKSDTTIYLTKTPYYEKFEVKEDIELGRFITPYGKTFPQGWSYTWTFDVTDYQYLLHDLQEIRSKYDGYSQGSLYTLDFDFIEGTPARDVFKIDVIYNGAFRYGDPNNSIENYLTEKTIIIPEDAKLTYLRLITTGHGFGGTDNAAEFSNYTHTVNVNGTKRFDQHLWRDDCGQNPVFPQGGTWVYDRGGWCPGADVYPFDYLLTPYISGGSVKVDYNMRPYTNLVADKPATYIIQGQIFHSRTAFKTDAEIAEIKAPNNAPQYRRMNPIATDESPVIVIKNNGTADINYLEIMYGIDGKLLNSRKLLNGLELPIKPFEKKEIVLSGFNLGDGEHTFSAAVRPWGQGLPDEYPTNDTLTVKYTPAKVYSGNIFLTLNNNYNPGYANGIRYEIIDMAGNILISKDGLKDKTTIRDTFKLDDGSYIFTIYDDAFGTGLMNPFITGRTDGTFLLKDSKDAVIYQSKVDYSLNSSWFGTKQKVSFTVVNGPTSIEEKELLKEGFFEVFPNPSDGTTLLRSAAEINRVEIFSPNGMLLKTLEKLSGNSVHIDMSEFATGYYIVRCTTTEGIKTLPLVKAE
ncbi:MAG: peptide-N-glycosidase F-related protein [Bacteroidota bacterium]